MIAPISELKSEKLWGHGKLPRLATRLWCNIVGHEWSPWHFDYPFDVPEYWEEIGLPYRDPSTDEEMAWGRACKRNCGVVETTTGTIRESHRLPGAVAGLDDAKRLEYGGTHLPG